MKKFFSFGNICLFLVALVLTIGTALIVKSCGGDRISCIMSSVFGGIIGTMAIGAVAEKTNAKIAESPAPGLIASLIGIVLVMLFI